MTVSESAQLIGTGIDLVHISTHVAQLAQPGSTFHAVYTDREWSYCMSIASATTARPFPRFEIESRPPSTRLGETGGHPPAFTLPQKASLAGCWAAKEAAIKAWSSALYGAPPPIAPEDLDWREVEVVHDRWRRPALQFHGRVARHLNQLVRDTARELSWHLTMSHDGDYAIASVHLSLTTFS